MSTESTTLYERSRPSKAHEKAHEGIGLTPSEACRLIETGESSAGGGIGALLAGSRTTLEDLMDRILRDSETCTRLIETTECLEKLKQIVRALGDVDQIASDNLMLALNARIEAVHIGERGAGFGIVAQELKEQAGRSRTITEDIRSTILRLSGDVQAFETEIQRLACADRAKIARLQDHPAHRRSRGVDADGTRSAAPFVRARARAGNGQIDGRRRAIPVLHDAQRAGRALGCLGRCD